VRIAKIAAGHSRESEHSMGMSLGLGES
jgi:hypothetical protein